MQVEVSCPSCSEKHFVELENGEQWECKCGLLLDIYDSDTETGYDVFIVHEDDLPLR